MYPNGYTSPAHDGALPKDTTSPHLTRLGKRVEELREKKGLTQTDLALASGVSRVYISGIGRGIRNLTVLRSQKLEPILTIVRLEDFHFPKRVQCIVGVCLD